LLKRLPPYLLNKVAGSHVHNDLGDIGHLSWNVELPSSGKKKGKRKKERKKKKWNNQFGTQGEEQKRATHRTCHRDHDGLPYVSSKKKMIDQFFMGKEEEEEEEEESFKPELLGFSDSMLSRDSA